ncbi:MAG: hypothetical protein ACYSW1_20215, partial [Planctomycetota bacterium]
VLAALCSILAGGCAVDSGGPPPGGEPLFEAGDWGEDRPDAVAPGQATPAAGTSRRTVWTIVLATFPSQGHQQAAANSVRQLPRIDAKLSGGAWVHTGADGSLMAYGRYESAQSEDAQRDLGWIKGLTLNDVPAFPRAMLTRVNLRPAAAGFDPLELMSARLRHPNVDPLYTLEVAVWSDFDSGKLSLKQIRRSAENYARTLRAKGYEAYYHHDDDRRLSMVTVGLFDRSAVDQRTGLYGPAVDVLLRDFPTYLVNGEELLEPMSTCRSCKAVTRPATP